MEWQGKNIDSRFVCYSARFGWKLLGDDAVTVPSLVSLALCRVSHGFV